MTETVEDLEWIERVRRTTPEDLAYDREKIREARATHVDLLLRNMRATLGFVIFLASVAGWLLLSLLVIESDAVRYGLLLAQSLVFGLFQTWNRDYRRPPALLGEGDAVSPLRAFSPVGVPALPVPYDGPICETCGHAVEVCDRSAPGH